MKKMLLLGALALLMAPVANATIINYDISISGTLATPTFGPGTVSGSGTGSLDDATGIFTFNTTLTANIPAAFITSVVDVSGDISGSSGTAPYTMTGATGTDQIDTCVDLNFTAGCGFIVLGNPVAMTSVGGGLAGAGVATFNVPPVWSNFNTQEIFAGVALASLNWTLTPEPGTAFLLLSGLAGLARFGRRA